MTLLIPLLAATVAWLAMLVLLQRASQWQLVDHPRGRKDHAAPIPTVGGLAIWMGFASALLMLGSPSSATLGLLAGGSVLTAVGVIDDRRDLHWLPRIIAQMGAALCLVVGGVSLQRLGYAELPLTLELGWLALPITLFAVVGIINAVNMVDGVDGLAGSLVLGSVLLIAALAQGGNPALTGELLALSAAVMVFLAFNLRWPGRPRARTFLGNSGSAMLGLALAWAAIRVSHEPAGVVTPALGPWLVALPILDCLTLIVRRRLSGRSPFAADRDHLHHLWLDRGWSVSRVVGAMLTLHLTLALLGLALQRLGVPDLGLIGLFLVLLGAHYAICSALGRQRANALASPAMTGGTHPPAG